MIQLRSIRERHGFSQRQLAALARVAFRTIQLIESAHHDPRLSTLQSIAQAMGYPRDSVAGKIQTLFETSPDSVIMISERILRDGINSWKLWLFNFVDYFRAHPDRALVESPPHLHTTEKILALLAATVETLCEEQAVPKPRWCSSIPPLATPWFVSETENLKAMALVESPVHFRKRNIFVLENFLERR